MIQARALRVVVVTLALLSICGCGSDDSADRPPRPRRPRAPEATPTPEPTATPEATPTPEPTTTPVATPTPTPTPTPTATPTPGPTATPGGIVRPPSVSLVYGSTSAKYFAGRAVPSVGAPESTYRISSITLYDVMVTTPLSVKVVQPLPTPIVVNLTRTVRPTPGPPGTVTAQYIRLDQVIANQTADDVLAIVPGATELLDSDRAHCFQFEFSRILAPNADYIKNLQPGCRVTVQADLLYNAADAAIKPLVSTRFAITR